jgi:hypothetical protein
MIKILPVVLITYAQTPRTAHENQGREVLIINGKAEGMSSVVSCQAFVIGAWSLVIPGSSRRGAVA